MQNVPLAKLVLNWSLYPRHEVDAVQVRRMVAALEAGEEFPPILCDKRSLSVVDGFHRHHAYRRFGGEEVKVPVTFKAYKDESEMLLDSVRLNARHGVPLEPLDQARVILLAQDLGIALVPLAEALAVPLGKIESIIAGRIATGPDGVPVILKRTIKGHAGRRLSKAQVAVNDRLTGMRPEYYLGRVVELIRHGLLDMKNPRVVELLGELKEALKDIKVAA